MSIDPKHRLGAMRHHTALHLLNGALRLVAPVVGQRGSSVSRDGLSFECSTFGKRLSVEDVAVIEDSVNKCIEADVPVKSKIVDMLQMLAEDNLTLVPGEVYPNTGIRIVEIDSKDLQSK